MDQDNLKAMLFYYFREKCYNLALSIAKEGIAKYKGEPSFHLYHALALILYNRIEEGIHILESIMSENEIKLSVVIAIMYANKLLGAASKDVFLKLDAKMKEIRKIAEPIDFYYSGFVLFSLHKLEKAIDYLDKALTMQSSFLECWALKGWALLELKKSGKKSAAIISDIFLQSLQSKNNIDAYFGLGEAYLYENNYDEAQSVANRMVVAFPDMDLPNLLKMRVQLALQNWDSINETLNNILIMNPNSLDALKTTILIMLCHEANFEEAVLCIKKYMTVFNETEPKNATLLLDTAKLFSQVCERNGEILNETYTMIESAAKSFPDNSEFVCELGFQCLMLNKLKEATRFFKSALKLDGSSARASMGFIFIDFQTNGLSDQTKDQIEQLLDMKGAQNSPVTMFFKAKISESEEEALNWLNKAADHHLNPIKHYPYSDNFLKLLNPDFMLQVVREYLKYVPFISDLTFNMNPKTSCPAAIAVENILTILHKACPGMLEPLFLLAKLQYHVIGDINNAATNLELILKRENISSEAYLLMAQIQIRNGTYERAAQSLEEGLSIDFKLKENALYHFINGVVQKKMNNLQDSIKSLTAAINIFNEKKSKTDISNKNDDLNTKAAIFIELIDAHNQIGQTDEAMKILEEATEALQKTPEESRIVLLCAEQAVNHNNIQGALDLLEKVNPADSYFSQARTKYANILLKYRKDKQAYLNCYLDMVNEDPCVETYMLLGEAYMTVLD
ncbi:hypothetical protein HHI36_012288 [Cryptolaemus montrouzieri]|uniref:Uncharacterized protein n=1 Tax=Cryptolaemus montrouzieri TaxID=559131 RepID=A0ABD2NDU6_9CUCU